jgi:hypothetical protein
MSRGEAPTPQATIHVAFLHDVGIDDAANLARVMPICIPGFWLRLAGGNDLKRR